MYQQYQQQQPQQSFHTAQYQGNVPNHDLSQRADSQRPSTYATGAVTSQYRGNQKQYQPTGYVQSFYGQNQAQNQAQNQIRFQTQNSAFSSGIAGQGALSQSAGGSFAGTNAFHTANYKGNLQGHDRSFTGDSQHPSQQFGFASAGIGAGFQASQAQFSQNQFNSNQQNQGQFSQAQSPQQFHTANYHGNQPGHDQSLSDSQNPSQSQASSYGAFQGSASGYQAAQPQYRSQFAGPAYQAQAAGPGYQAQSPQQFHTANYRGNQPGHDQSLGDSQNPNQSQFFAR